jgi:hypothetical protein
MKIVIYSDNTFYSTKDSTGKLWRSNASCCLCKYISMYYPNCPFRICPTYSKKPRSLWISYYIQTI